MAGLTEFTLGTRYDSRGATTSATCVVAAIHGPDVLLAGDVPADLRGRLVWAWRRDMTSPAARMFGERARRHVTGQ
ncbi:hypothetical protein C6A85_13550 [Mycobacterium sp. ITM-2017-0098]|nr:hypothetical protein C6A85_13550 [Mycobacterium sp. ITM-2017-0098]